MRSPLAAPATKTKRLIIFSSTAFGWLRSEAGRLDISVSEFVRRIVDEKRERNARAVRR